MKFNGENVRALTLGSVALLKGDPPPTDELSKEMLVSLLLHHELGPLASWRIRSSVVWQSWISHDLKAKLDQTVLHAKVRRSLVYHALEDVWRLLDGLRPVLFKGIALAQVYPDPIHRNPGDLDILVHRANFLEAVQRLENAGWLLEPSVHRDRPNDVADNYGFALVYRHPTRPVIVDLHRAPVDKTEPFWLDPEILFEHTIEQTLPEGLRVSTFSPEVHLAICALHSVRHGNFRLGWFTDLWFALHEWQHQLDSESFRAFCRGQKIERAVKTAFGIMTELFGSCWHPYSDVKVDKGTKKAIRKRSPEVVVHGFVTHSASWRRIVALSDIMDSIQDRVRYIWKTVFPSPLLFTTKDSPKPKRMQYLLHRVKTFCFLLKQTGDSVKERK